MLSVRDHLRIQMDLEDEECHVMPGPEPMPSCGQKFIAVYGHSWNASPDDFNASEALVEWYGFTCAVSFRSSYVPFDRFGEELYVKALTGIEDFCREIMGNLHLNQSILNATNALINSEQNPFHRDGMLEQPRWASTDANPMLVGGDWFSASPDDMAGLVMEVRFEQATRYQAGPRSPTGHPLT